MKNFVKQLRDDRKISQTDLANAVNVSRQTIHSIESGKFIPTTLLALKIARYFKVPFEQIFALDEAE